MKNHLYKQKEWKSTRKNFESGFQTTGSHHSQALNISEIHKSLDETPFSRLTSLNFTGSRTSSCRAMSHYNSWRTGSNLESIFLACCVLYHGVTQVTATSTSSTDIILKSYGHLLRYLEDLEAWKLICASKRFANLSPLRDRFTQPVLQPN